MKPFLQLIASAALAAGLSGCASVKETMEAMVPQQGGLVAQLRSPSSAATGVVHVFDHRDGVQVQLAITNLIPGAYRIAIHERGNCRSPNLFSAGPAWAPPGWTKPAGDLLPGFIANNDGNENGYVAFVKGVRTEGPQSIRGQVHRDPLGQSGRRSISGAAQQPHGLRRARFNTTPIF